MEINPRHVLVFKQVVDAGSISAGARALGWRQPSVTAQVQALERALGVPLLLRRPTGVTPTQAGQSVLEHARAIASHLDAMARETQEQRARRLGTVRLACFASALSSIVPAALAALRRRYPDIDVQLAEAEPGAALELLDAGRADIAIVYRHVGDPRAFELAPRVQVPLADDQVLLILPGAHPLAARPALALADLADEDWIITYERCRDHLIDLCHQAGFEPRVKHESDDNTVIYELVRRGLAVAAVTQSSLGASKLADVAVCAVPELTSHQVNAVCLPGAERVPSVQAVLEALQALTSN
ncbi:MAG: LysR family transcriptional regulator [Propionibacteriaceae bacterium]|jgi:DNA-binding transcriptional LysR family regulator|nr:LysR family transcriptional regulator [Propionibacteriaceae bacterium]